MIVKRFAMLSLSTLKRFFCVSTWKVFLDRVGGVGRTLRGGVGSGRKNNAGLGLGEEIGGVDWKSSEAEEILGLGTWLTICLCRRLPRSVFCKPKSKGRHDFQETPKYLFVWRI